MTKQLNRRQQKNTHLKCLDNVDHGNGLVLPPLGDFALVAQHIELAARVLDRNLLNSAHVVNGFEFRKELSQVSILQVRRKMLCTM